MAKGLYIYQQCLMTRVNRQKIFKRKFAQVALGYSREKRYRQKIIARAGGACTKLAFHYYYYFPQRQSFTSCCLNHPEQSYKDPVSPTVSTYLPIPICFLNSATFIIFLLSFYFFILQTRAPMCYSSLYVSF